MQYTKKLIFNVDEKDIRIDKFLHEKLKVHGYSREQVKALILKGAVCVIGEKFLSLKPKTKVGIGDRIEVILPKTEVLMPEKGNLNVVYEDEYLVVIDKPPYLTTHPAPSCRETTLVNILLHRYPQIRQLDRERPGIVHRLDKDTSGLMVVALKKEVQDLLKEAFSKRKVKKKYLVLVHGKMRPPCGEIKLLMDRDHVTKTKMRVYADRGRESITRYRVIREFQGYNISFIEAEILTGRTHQIRLHFSYKGHPVLGDKIYSNGKKIHDEILRKLVKRQMLHAWKLEFEHPITGESLKFTSPVPGDFYRTLLYLGKKRPMVVGVTGSVGCGKSKVCELLSKGRYPLWSADVAVENLYKKGNAGYEMIKRTFGESFVNEKEVNKKHLFMHMATDRNFREEVERIIHPLVYMELKSFLEKHKRDLMVIAEVPLLVEAGWKEDRTESIFDVVIGVFCENEVRFKRLEKIRGWTREQILNIDKWQMPQEQKLKQCHIIVDNSYSLDRLKHQITILQDILKDIRRKRLFKEIYRINS